MIADGQWHVYEWSLANASNFIPFPGTAGTGILPSTGYLTIDPILFNSSADQSATIWLDAVAFNTRGDLANLPEPMSLVPATAAAAFFLTRRRRNIASCHSTDA